MANVVAQGPAVQISNREFLAGVFGLARWGDAHVTAFWGDPAKGYWAGKRASAQRFLEDRSRNQYFTVSQFWDDPSTGRSTRRDRFFRAMFCLVVDDVGTRVDRNLVQSKFPPPSWRLETSPGNEQWGWIFEMPELDGGRAKTMADMLVANGLTPDRKDPGMKGVGRYVRMPVGTNWKPALGPGGFECVLLEWRPDRRYWPDELMTGWGLTLPGPGEVALGGSGRGAHLDQDALDKDIVLAAMDELGWVGEERHSGWGYACSCPCADEHSSGGDSGCGYRPGPAGGWVCHHGTCQSVVWVPGQPPGSRPWYQFYAGLERGLVAHGLDPMRKREFEVVDENDPDHVAQVEGCAARAATRGPQRSATAETTLADWVFSKPDNMFYQLSARIAVPRPAFNSIMTPRMGADLAYQDDKGKTKYLSPDKWFFSQPDHRVVDGLSYWPGEAPVFEAGSGMLANRYREVTLEDPGRRIATREVKLWLDLVKHVLGAEGGRAIVRFLDWCAGVVADPSMKPGWMVVIQGKQGIGKDMILRPVVQGVGEDNGQAIDADMLGSGFSGYAEKRLVVVKELRQTTKGAASGHDQYNRIKWLVDPTAPTLTVNPKYGRPFEAKNVIAVAVTTNELDAVALDPQDRRAFVFVSDADKWPAARYRALLTWMDAWSGWELVVWWLRQRWARIGQNRRAAVSGNAPRTAGREKMLMAAGGPVFAWVRQQIEQDPTPDWPDVLSAGQVVANVTRALANPGSGLPRHMRAPSEDQAGKWLAQLGAMRLAKGAQVRTKKLGKVRLWAIRGSGPERFASLGPAALGKLVDEDKINEFDGPVVVTGKFGGEQKGQGDGSGTESGTGS